MRRYRLASLLVLVALAALIVPGTASASNFSGANGLTGCSYPSPVNMADTWEHTFFYSSLKTNVRDAQNWANTNIYDPLQIKIIYLSSPTSTTDVVVYDQYYTTFCGWNWATIGGLTSCVSLNSAKECEKHEVRYDNADVDAGGTTYARFLACHETGHSLGLKHRSEGCMRDDGLFPNWLAQHDKDHINAAYYPN